MNKVCYICKYTPLELMAGFGAKCQCLNQMPQEFGYADQVSHPNICGFGKSVLEAVLSGNVKELVLVNCCDTIKSIYDLLLDSQQLDFLYMLDILHFVDSCSVHQTSLKLKEFAHTYAEYSRRSFDRDAFFAAFRPHPRSITPHIGVLGARVGDELFTLIQKIMPLTVTNETCVHNRNLTEAVPDQSMDFDALMDWYAHALLNQLPCMRMTDNSKRKELFMDPSLKSIIYHTVKFCDFYGFEYSCIKNHVDLPFLKIESDFTMQTIGQLETRLEAFKEELEANVLSTKPTPHQITQTKPKSDKLGMYFAGIDSGSTSTDVVILNKDKKIISSIVLPTGAGASKGADRALTEALALAGLAKDDISRIVSTGYGRTAIEVGDKSITEISCHAKGAFWLDPSVRTVIDIGGQDSKIICLNDDGSVRSFVMNDKCAAGTGRFLEMMAKTMEMSLNEISQAGLNYQEDITISNMCTVFAESEVVSLIALNKRTDDIIHGLNKAVASKTVSLVKRVGGAERFMMTGGVARNRGLVTTLEERLNTHLIISDKAQLCGALGAALFAIEIYR